MLVYFRLLLAKVIFISSLNREILKEIPITTSFLLILMRQGLYH